MKIANCNLVLTAELVVSLHNGRQRIYRLSQPITTGMHGPIKPSLDDARERGAEKWKHLIPEEAHEWDLVCISDAHTHIERLVFLGIMIEPDKGGPLIYDAIAGETTFMINGGDPSTIQPDSAYLSYLAEINHFKFEGIINGHENS